MAFHPATGLVYIPARVGTQMVHVPDKRMGRVSTLDRDNVGIDGNYEGPLYARMASMTPPTGELLAWDPVKQEAVWRAKYPVLDGAGVLATAGNLIFQGRADGIFAAYRATDGEPLWRFDAATGIMAPPVTYTVGSSVRYRPGRVGWFVGTDEYPGSRRGTIRLRSHSYVCAQRHGQAGRAALRPQGSAGTRDHGETGCRQGSPGTLAVQHSLHDLPWAECDCRSAPGLALLDQTYP